MKTIVMIGIPGSGKGTQTKLISNKYDIKSITLGNLLRKIAKTDSYVKDYLDKGELVPDSIIADVLTDELKTYKDNDCIILDGFPRSYKQLIYFKKLNFLPISAIYISIPRESVYKRLSIRLTCTYCNTISTIYNNKKIDDNNYICSICNSTIHKRSDDNLNTVRRRINVYDSEISPVLLYFKELGILHKINGEEEVNSVFSNIDKLLHTLNV